ncbi:MAG: FAD-dependent oxidoreductase [Candidatus Woesearchaeota archaeon]
MITTGIITKNMQLAPDIHEFWITLPGPLPYRSGQFVFISLDGEDKHAFSIVSSRSEGKEIRLVIKKRGLFTIHLFEITEESKTSITVQGPYGQFILPQDLNPLPLLFIAGGIGVTPIASMVFHLAQDKALCAKHLPIIYYSTKTRSERVFAKEFDQLVNDRASGLDIRYVCTAEGGVRISVEQLLREVPDLKTRIVYICGPRVMINTLREGLLAIGMQEEQVRSEEFK